MMNISRAAQALNVVVVAVLVACNTSSKTEAQQTTPPGGTLPAPVSNASIDASRQTAITRAVARVAPTVVTVQTEILERVAAVRQRDAVRRATERQSAAA